MRALAGIALSTALAGALLTAPATADEPVIREWWDYQQIPSPAGSSGDYHLTDSAIFRIGDEGAVSSTADLEEKAPPSVASWTTAPLPRPLEYARYDTAGPTELALATVRQLPDQTFATLSAGFLAAGASEIETIAAQTISLPRWSGVEIWRMAATESALFAIVDYRDTTQPLPWKSSFMLSRYDRASSQWAAPIGVLEQAGVKRVDTPNLLALDADGPRVAVAWTYAADPDLTARGDIHVARSLDGGHTWSALDPLESGTPEGWSWSGNTSARLHWFDDGLLVAWESSAHKPNEPMRSEMRAAIAAGVGPWGSVATFPGRAFSQTLSTGTLTGRLALSQSSGEFFVYGPDGWMQVGDAGTEVRALAGDHAVARDNLYSVDTTAPTISGHEPTFSHPGGGPSSTAKDTGGIRLQTCRVDGHDVALDNYGRCSGTPTANGPHTLVHEAVDIAGHTSSRTLNWITDGVPPVVKWKSYPGRWARSTSGTWWWYASDAHSGLESFDVQLNGSGPRGSSVDSRTTRPGYSRSAYLAMPEGQTICAKVTPTDRAHLVGRTIGPSCSTAPLDDRRLWHRAKRIKRLTGGSYFRDTVTSLTEIGSQLSYDSTNFVIDVAVLARKCPTCGTIRIAGPGRSWTVNLRSSTTGVRAIEVPLYGELNRGRTTVTKVGYGSVLIDGLYLRSEVVY